VRLLTFELKSTLGFGQIRCVSFFPELNGPAHPTGADALVRARGGRPVTGQGRGAVQNDRDSETRLHNPGKAVELLSGQWTLNGSSPQADTCCQQNEPLRLQAKRSASKAENAVDTTTCLTVGREM
jgi:hypothetical protein